MLLRSKTKQFFFVCFAIVYGAIVLVKDRIGGTQEHWYCRVPSTARVSTFRVSVG